MEKDSTLKTLTADIWAASSYDTSWESHCEMLAAELYDAGWRKPIETEWIPVGRYLEKLKCYAIIGYACSNCKTKVEEYTNYCAYCGARMEVRDKQYGY